MYLIHYNRDKYTMLRSKYTIIRDTPSTYPHITLIVTLARVLRAALVLGSLSPTQTSEPARRLRAAYLRNF